MTHTKMHKSQRAHKAGGLAEWLKKQKLKKQQKKEQKSQEKHKSGDTSIPKNAPNKKLKVNEHGQIIENGKVVGAVGQGYFRKGAVQK